MSILVWGHRGYRHDRFPEKYPDAAHESSLNAFEYALQHCSGLETDIIISKQNTIFLTHDTLFSDKIYYEFKTHFDEASKNIIGDRFIFEMDDIEIDQLRMVDGNKLTRLTELFALMPKYPGSVLNLELKGPHTNTLALAAVERAMNENLITAEQITFSSFNLPQLRMMRSIVGDRFKIGALYVRHIQTRTAMFPHWPMIGDKPAPLDAFYIPFDNVENLVNDPDLQAINPDYFNVEYRSLTEESIAAIDKFNPQAKLILWAAAEPYPDEDSFVIDIIEKFALTGKIYAVMSDFPEILQQQMEQRGLAKQVLKSVVKP